MDLEPTSYRVSTITCNASVSTKVNLDRFFEYVSLNGPFVWSEHGEHTRGVYPKKRRASMKERKSFDNQTTVIYQFHEKYMPNIKLFRNGNIHMTGIRTLEDGDTVVRTLADEIRRIAKEHAGDIVENVEWIRPGEFKIRMINSDFRFPFKIRRKSLHQLLISSVFNNNCIFQPLTYPGVKLMYYWNGEFQNKNGICTCGKPCFGKGSGSGDGECKKVTVSVFDSGTVLITGANDFQQVTDAYHYICMVVGKYRNDIAKILPSPETGTHSDTQSSGGNDIPLAGLTVADSS